MLQVGRGAELKIGAHSATEFVRRHVPVRVGPIPIHIAVIVNLDCHDSPGHVTGVVRAGGFLSCCELCETISEAVDALANTGVALDDESSVCAARQILGVAGCRRVIGSNTFANG